MNISQLKLRGEKFYIIIIIVVVVVVDVVIG
jgi:hypothetical protein